MKVRDMIKAQKEYTELKEAYNWARKLNNDLHSIEPKSEENAAYNNNNISKLFHDMTELVGKTVDDMKKQLDEMEV